MNQSGIAAKSATKSAAKSAAKTALWLSRILAIATATVFAASPALAQAKYPDRPVRMILPFGAGGVADITSRLVAEKLGAKLGQRFIVENVPGAGGIAAARAALAGGADGYTLILVTNGTSISVPLFKSLPFDPVKDFAPISSIGYFECVFVTNASSPYKTLPDFLKAAREKPGALNVGAVNIGSTQNLTVELFKSMAGIDFVNVPFRTTPDVVVALLRNDLQLGVDFYAALQSGLSDNKLRAIATTGPQRSKSLPDVPTVQEGGVANFDVVAWNALYAPAGTPQPVIDTLNRALQEVLADPDLKKRALDLGIETKASTPQEIDAHLRGDIAKWGKVIAAAGIPKQ
jgi:tripartite-type tricarboxylate transporter receptor subunit TctC